MRLDDSADRGTTGDIRRNRVGGLRFFVPPTGRRWKGVLLSILAIVGFANQMFSTLARAASAGARGGGDADLHRVDGPVLERGLGLGAATAHRDLRA